MQGIRIYNNVAVFLVYIFFIENFRQKVPKVEDTVVVSSLTYQAISNMYEQANCKKDLSRMFQNCNGIEVESIINKQWIIFPCKVKR